MGTDQGKRGWFKPELDLSHILTAVLMFGGLMSIYKSNTEWRITQDMRWSAVEQKIGQQEKTNEKITETLRIISENQVKLAVRLDAQEKMLDNDNTRIRDLERVGK